MAARLGPLPTRESRSPAAGARRRGRRRGPSRPSASCTVAALAHRRGNSAHSTRAHVSASASARWATSTSMPRASASTVRPRRRCSGSSWRAIAAVQSTGGSGQSRPMRSNAWRRTRRSNGALWATITRPASRSRTGGRTSSSEGAPSTIAWVMPVSRWTPRRSGALVRHSELQRSCSSPPPTSTAPTSVSSQSAPPRPLVSVSITMNSAVAMAAASSSISAVIRPAPDGVQESVLPPRVRNHDTRWPENWCAAPTAAPPRVLLTAERGSIGTAL